MKKEMVAAYAAKFTVRQVTFRLGGSAVDYNIRTATPVVCDKVLIRGPVEGDTDVWVSLFVTPKVWNDISPEFGHYDVAVLECIVREKHTTDDGKKVFLLAEEDDCGVVNVQKSEIKRPYPMAVTFDGSAKEDVAPGA